MKGIWILIKSLGLDSKHARIHFYNLWTLIMQTYVEDLDLSFIIFKCKSYTIKK